MEDGDSPRASDGERDDEEDTEQLDNGPPDASRVIIHFDVSKPHPWVRWKPQKQLRTKS